MGDVTARKRCFVTRVCILRGHSEALLFKGDRGLVEIFRCMIPVLIDVNKAHRCSRELTHLRSNYYASNGRPHGQKSG
jgi:hypothetical protein